MPRAMVHPRLKRRIVSETPTAFSPSPTPEVAHENNKPSNAPASDAKESDAEHEGSDEAGPRVDSSMDISDEEGIKPPRRNTRGSDLQAADSDAELKQGSNTAPPTPKARASLTHLPDTQVGDSLQEDEGSQPAAGPSNPKSSSPSPPPHVAKDASPGPASTSVSANQSPPPPAHPRLKIKLRLGARPTQSTKAPSEGSESVKEVKRRRGKGKAREVPPLPPRVTRNRPETPDASSHHSASRSQSPPSAESEEADDADAESEDEAEPERHPEPEPDDEQPMDVDSQVPVSRGELADDIESEDEVDMPEDDMDDSGEDSEVLPGRRRPGTRAKLTARQAVLASMAGAEHVELEASTSSRKKHLTSEEIALRREETARKRKNMSEKKLEDEKTETINRLLKKQSSRSRAKRSALASVVPTPQSPHSGEEGESGDGEPSARGTTIPGPAWRWTSSRAGMRLGIPDEAEDARRELAAMPVNVVRAPAICDVAGCKEVRKYRLVHDFERGACGMEHLKILNGQVAG